MSMTIGEVIESLKRAKPDLGVAFAFGYVVPTTVASWRGIYAEAALGYKYDGLSTGRPKVKDVLKELKKAIDGRTYCGWKGGDFKYTAETPLHIDNPGEYSSTELIRVEVTDWLVTLHTAKEDT